MPFFQAFVTVATELIARLRPCPPQHMRAGNVLKLTTLSPVEEDNMVPSKLKIRDRALPVAGEIYRMKLSSETAVNFIDGRTGKQCRSRDNTMIRLYPHPHCDFCDLKGELRFFTCPKGTEPIITPMPVFVTKVTGIREQGVWWIAALAGTHYGVSWTEPSDRILFTGNVMVMLGALPERAVNGAVAIDIADRVTVYDRRKERLSSFARAEHIRRTINNGRVRTFEFINLRDVATGEVVENGGPERVLTPEGLVAVEEVEA